MEVTPGLAEPGAGSPSLNLDVLATLCTFLTDDRDILSFSETCSALRPVAVMHLLSSRPVFLRNPTSVGTFHDFVFSDAAARLPHITALEVYPLVDDPDALALVLRESYLIRNYKCLGDPRIVAAIGKLTTLRSLTVVNYPGNMWTISSVSTLLSHLQSTLATLRLDLLIAQMHVPDLTEFYPEFRERNREAQERRTWTRLQQLICGAPTFYLLGLLCPIDICNIHDCDVHSKQYVVDTLQGMRPPSRLKLHVKLSKGLEVLRELIPPETAATLTHLTLCLVYDDYDRLPRSDALSIQWDELWQTVQVVLGQLPVLTHLRILFHCNDRSTARGFPDDHFVNALRPATFDFTAAASTIMLAVPYLQYAFLATSACITISRRAWPEVAVAECDRWLKSRAWRIAALGEARGDATRRELVPLHPGKAETIIRHEDLVLSDYAEEDTRLSTHY
ncbi:hypothetical protein DICSQDRAFT_165302 [Dichomitus squalens LYAD-421 SS1]|uniref:uncharacterized protein n=1 Tax=Dichomitus squalens (strain LYAD-421) TaxID=732165 RepID=UPI000441533A|nr:uncharacterized protein DICSQDRAFT_165302 [Dichomitus squalens LYAD-421 SS1]EJF67477.1 hypothetical protein DICSQDRAFT_165302 [Dichomitus squalens LYAD-421 SS1]